MADRTIPPIVHMDHLDNMEGIMDDTASIASSNVSTTSTEMFEHEPFDTFKSKVIKLCKKKGRDLPKDAFTITGMGGGSYNRVIGIHVDESRRKMGWRQRILQTIRPSKKQTTQTTHSTGYILRIPRYEHAWLEHEVAILKYLQHTTIPAPIVKTWSLSNKSPIKSRYTIQSRLPGQSVEEVYLDLNTQQRVSFARELGTALKEMGKLRSSCAGTLDPYNTPTDSSTPELLHLQCPPRNALRPGSSESPTKSSPMSVYDFLLSQFARQRAYDLTLHRDHLNTWKPFTAIINHLHNKGFLKDNIYALTHMDFEPRNILLNTTSPTTASLSGILDWDEAVFAPCFTNCKPPSWLWDFEGEDDEELDECVAAVTPQEPHLVAIKEAFDEAVGEQFLKYAYTPEYRIARDICRLAITGFHSNDEYEQAEKMVGQWNELYPDCEVGGISGT